MPYMKEHIDAGIQASLVVVGLLLWAYTRGIITTHYDLVGLSVFAVTGIVIGSDLPDIDAKRAPISKMFQIAVPGTVVLVSFGLGLRPPIAFLLGAIGLWLYATHMPRHRGVGSHLKSRPFVRSRGGCSALSDPARPYSLPLEWAVLSLRALRAPVEGPVD